MIRFWRGWQVTLGLVAVILVATPLQATVLDVPEVIQEQNQWCWAGVSAACLDYYGTPVAQCSIAEYTRSVATWHDFGSQDCCVDSAGLCNYWNYNYAVAGSIQDILSHWGVASYGTARALSQAECNSQIDAGRPFIIRWAWDSGGGHFVVGHGSEGDSLYYMNPWFGEGLKIGTYSWVVSGGGHTWTHTNVITEPHCVCQTVDACCDGCNPLNPGGACEDGDLCTGPDSCQQGLCVGGPSVQCQAAGQCRAAGVCDPASGVCSDPARPDGTACDDADACTLGDACAGGQCQPGQALDCSQPPACHLPGTCDPLSGQCDYPQQTDGSICDDANACTRSDACVAGGCAGSDPLICDAPTDCQEPGNCDPLSGTCAYPARPDGTACDDGDGCTSTDRCQSGLCIGADPVMCGPPDDCHTDATCEPATGLCRYPARPDGALCDDGDGCTRQDACLAGACVGSDPVACPAPEACHAQGSCQPDSGTCTDPVLPTGTACDDSNPCTGPGACTDGGCAAGEALSDWTDCGPSRACFAAVCEPVPPGDRCDDSLALDLDVPRQAETAGFHAYLPVGAPCALEPLEGQDVFLRTGVEPGWRYHLIVGAEPPVRLAVVSRSGCADPDVCRSVDQVLVGDSAEVLETAFEQKSDAIWQLIVLSDTRSVHLDVLLQAEREATGCGCGHPPGAGPGGLIWLGLLGLGLVRSRRD